MKCKVYTDVDGIYNVCPPVRKIIHSLKLVDYLHVQANNPWYNYYVYTITSLDPSLSCVADMPVSNLEMYILCNISLHFIEESDISVLTRWDKLISVADCYFVRIFAI